jgi:hypothetical protein
VGSRAGLNTVSERKIPSPHRDSNPDHPARGQSEVNYIRLFRIVDITSGILEFIGSNSGLYQLKPADDLCEFSKFVWIKLSSHNLVSLFYKEIAT